MSTLESLGAKLLSWDKSDKSVARAEELREKVRALPDPKKGGASPEERAILQARSGYAKKKPLELERLRKQPEVLAALGPFLGDPAMGRWPFHAPLEIADEEAMGWLPVLAEHAAVDEPLRALVRTMFRVRRREVWLSASRALAKIALRDEAARSFLGGELEASFHGAVPREWRGGRLLAGGAGEDVTHAARHAMHAGSTWLALGGDAALLGGVSAEAIAGAALPKSDPSDASVMLLSLHELVSGSATRERAVGFVAARVAEAPCHPLVDDALRELSGALRGHPARALVLARLIEPRWASLRGDQAIDGLHAWVRTAAWLANDGETAAVDEMTKTAGVAATAVRLSRGDAVPDVVAAVLERLAIVADDDVWLTTLEPQRAAALVELLLLLDRDAIRRLEWSRLLRRAVRPPSKLPEGPGEVKDVARVGLALLFSGRDEHPATVMRDVRFGEAAVLSLAASPDGFLARQVAVEMERLLRETKNQAEQARLLWRLLQRDPPSVTFRELFRDLRGEGTALHAVVGAMETLDAARDRGAPVDAFVSAYAALAVAARPLLGARSPLDALVSDVEAAAALGALPDDVDAWLVTLRRVLVGGDGESGLEAWLVWLGAPVPSLRPAWERFAGAVRSAAETRPDVTAEQCAELRAAITGLSSAVRVATWPEGLVVQRALDEARAWEERLRGDSRRQAELGARVKNLLDRGDEEAIVHLVFDAKDTTLDQVHADLLRRVSRFLLRRLRLRAASRLRAREAGRAQLPGPWSHVAPLAMGATSGPFLVLQGGAWNELTAPGHELPYVLTVATALVVSYAYLASSVATVLAPGHRGSAVMRFVRAAGRVFPIYVISLAIATALAALLLKMLAETESTQIGDAKESVQFAAALPLWGSLSLFFGMFLGLIFQGRGAFGEAEE